jgi:queuine/archaeosine tRNA-ribosyltransferase
MSSFRKFTLQ